MNCLIRVWVCVCINKLEVPLPFGWAFGLVIKQQVEMAVAHIRVPGLTPTSAAKAILLLIHTPGGSRWVLAQVVLFESLAPPAFSLVQPQLFVGQIPFHWVFFLSMGTYLFLAAAAAAAFL